MTVKTISPRELHDLVCSGQQAKLIDVRTPAEFQEVHVTFAVNVPLHQFNAKEFVEDNTPSQQPIYVICKSGARARQACEKLVAAGCGCVINVEGGTMAWDRACLPVVRGKRTMSLERQVRIIAGALVVLGSILAIGFDQPLWSILSGACGLGLMHAGITDSCLMGMILSVMPWNQSGAKSQTKSSNSSGSCSP